MNVQLGPGDPPAQVDLGATGAVVTNYGPGTVSYADNPDVRSTAEGTIASGSSVTLTGSQWFSATTPATISTMPALGPRTTLDASDFGAVGDGVHDDLRAIQRAIDAAAALGGARVRLAAGTFLVSGTIVLPSFVALEGCGRLVTIVKLAGAANVDILNSTGFAALTGGTSTGGIHHAAIRHIGFDGNRSANTSGNGIRLFGYSLELEDVMVRSCAVVGLTSEWGNQTIAGSTTSQLVNRLAGFTIHDCGSWGVEWKGPHDSIVSDGEVYRNAQLVANRGQIHVTGFGSATHFVSVHGWGLTAGSTNTWAIESQAFLVDCVGEGGAGSNCYISASATTVHGGNFFTGSTTDLIGLTIDGAAANYTIVTQTIGCDNGAINFVSDGGNGFVMLTHSGGAKVVKGTPAASTVVMVQGPTTATYDAPAAVWHARGFRAHFRDNGQAGCLTGPNAGTAMLAANIAANRAIWVRWVAPRDMTVTKIAFGVATAASVDDSVDVGIASTAGTLLGSTGSTAGLVNSTGAKAPSLLASVAVKAGTTYYVGLAYGAVGGTAANLLGFNGATASATLFGSAVGVIESLRLDTAFPLATTSAFSGYATAGAWPLFALRES